jgi:hypothetical protein
VAVDPALFPAHNAPPAAVDAPGYIRVVSRGGTARVRIDGQTFGFCPIVIRVDAGPHVVALESSGDAFLPSQITVNAMPNDTTVATFIARAFAPGSPSPDTSHTTLPHSAADSAKR